MRRLAPLTREQCEYRLNDVRRRAAEGPTWRNIPCRELYTDKTTEAGTKVSALSEEQQARYRAAQVVRWHLHESNLIAAMEEQLSWGA